MITTDFYRSPIGTIFIQTESDKVTGVEFIDDEKINIQVNPSKLTAKVISQLEEYFSGKRKVFDLPLELYGTEFRKKVWSELRNIPYGKKSTYREIARVINCENGWRAVGTANHYNPIVIIVPCHRVVKSDGTIGGYGGGLWRKEYLLNLEIQ